MMDTAKVQKEFGFNFTHEVRKRLPSGWKLFSYKWTYFPNNKSGQETIACRNDTDFNELFVYWSKSGGKYYKYEHVEVPKQILEIQNKFMEETLETSPSKN